MLVLSFCWHYHFFSQEVSASVSRLWRDMSGQYSDFHILSSLNSQVRTVFLFRIFCCCFSPLNCIAYMLKCILFHCWRDVRKLLLFMFQLHYNAKLHSVSLLEEAVWKFSLDEHSCSEVTSVCTAPIVKSAHIWKFSIVRPADTEHFIFSGAHGIDTCQQSA